MKIVFCVNHSFPSVGGCEKVVDQLSTIFVKKYYHKSVVLSKSFQRKDLINDGVVIKALNLSPNGFIKQLKDENPDYILVYSDLFFHLQTLINNIDQFDCGIGLALVGASAIQKNRILFNDLIKNKEKIDFITHADNYVDTWLCKKYDLNPHVIHNAVDLNEFNIDHTYFREKYKIKNKIVLCVSNFFPGKGQKELLEILKNVKEDFTAVFICSSSPINVVRSLQNEFHNHLSNYSFPILFLEDISRKEVISAFKSANVFAFPSKKEAFGMVLIESMAAKTPWVAFPVGATAELEGGVVVESAQRDSDDNIIFTQENMISFSQSISKLLTDEELNNKLSQEGYDQVLNKYDLEDVALRYSSLIKRKYK